MPVWVAVVLGAQAVALVVIGVGLFVAPTDTAELWPWTLTPLTGRAVGAWLIGIGVAGVHALVENDMGRLRAACIGYLSLGVFHLVALARYGGDVAWNQSGAWIYLAFLIVAVVLGSFGWFRADRARAPPPPWPDPQRPLLRSA
jgi:hypothetical protein